MAPRTPLLITLVGGTGFIGRATTAELLRRGHKVRLVARHAPAQPVAGVQYVEADTSQPHTLPPALAGSDVVVHLVAMLAERGTSFDTVIHQGAQQVAQAAKAAGVAHMVYVSALGASPTSTSAYARAKGLAEAAVRQVFPQATILRPSLVMGAGGGFVRQIEKLTRHTPFMVLPGGGHTRFQPVELPILARQIADACENENQRGHTYDAAGPTIFTFRQLAVQEVTKLGRKRLFLPLPWSLTWLVAYAMAFADKLTCHRLIPDWFLVTPDQVSLLQKDNVSA